MSPSSFAEMAALKVPLEPAVLLGFWSVGHDSYKIHLVT
jgi:hypothetical protein